MWCLYAVICSRSLLYTMWVDWPLPSLLTSAILQSIECEIRITCMHFALSVWAWTVQYTILSPHRALAPAMKKKHGAVTAKTRMKFKIIIISSEYNNEKKWYSNQLSERQITAIATNYKLRIYMYKHTLKCARTLKHWAMSNLWFSCTYPLHTHPSICCRHDRVLTFVQSSGCARARIAHTRNGRERGRDGGRENSKPHIIILIHSNLIFVYNWIGWVQFQFYAAVCRCCSWIFRLIANRYFSLHCSDTLLFYVCINTMPNDCFAHFTLSLSLVLFIFNLV